MSSKTLVTDAGLNKWITSKNKEKTQEVLEYIGQRIDPDKFLEIFNSSINSLAVLGLSYEDFIYLCEEIKEYKNNIKKQTEDFDVISHISDYGKVSINTIIYLGMFENDRYHYQFYQITEGKPDIQLCDNLLDINETENYDFYKKLLGAEFNDEFTYDKTHYKIANIWNLWDFKREIVDIKYDCSDIDDGDIIVVKHKNRIVFSQACRYDSYYYKTRYEDFYTIDGLNFEGYSYTREDENGTLFIDEGSKDVDEKELLNVIKFDRFTQRMGIKPKELENENTTYNKKKQLKY